MLRRAFLSAFPTTTALFAGRQPTSPAFNEAMWAKYGKIFGDNMSASDKTAHPNPTTNVYATRLANLAKQRMRFAVCNLTTRAYASIISRETGQKSETIQQELTSNTIGTAFFVPAGIIAVTRAQERGYAYVSIG